MSEQTLPATVQSCENLPSDILRVTVSFQKPKHLHLPGQYLMLEVAEAWIPLSIASIIAPQSLNASATDVELHIKVREGSSGEAFESALVVGSSVNIRYPLGECVFSDSSVRSLLLIAGGTGFSQMKAILESGLSLGTEKIVLVWLAKDPSEYYLADWLESHVQKDRFEYTPLTIDHTQISESEYKRLFTNAIIAHGFEQDQEVQTYLAGAPPMVRLLADYLTELGFSRDRLKSDVFDLNL